MRVKTILAAIALATLTGMSASAGCAWDHTKESASQCGEGYAFDDATQSCVRTTTS